MEMASLPDSKKENLLKKMLGSIKLVIKSLISFMAIFSYVLSAKKEGYEFLNITSDSIRMARTIIGM